MVYKVPLRDVVDLKSRGCRKLNRGNIVLIILPIYSEYCCVPGILLYGRMRFDDVCLLLKFQVEITKFDHDWVDLCLRIVVKFSSVFDHISSYAHF